MMTLIPAIAAFAVRHGVQPPDLLRAAGLDPQRFADGADEPVEVTARIWKAAAVATGDPDLGLHFAEWVLAYPASRFDLLRFAVNSCSTLGDHFSRMERYIRLLQPETFVRLTREGSVARLAHGLTNGAVPPREPVDCMLALALLNARLAVKQEVPLLEARFAYAVPRSLVELTRVFGRTLRFGAPVSELLFDASVLDFPQPSAEPRLLALLDDQIEGLIAALPDELASSRVRRAIVELLPDREPTLALVAGRLHLGARSLQRRLSDEGTTFGELLDKLRRDHAVRYLRDGRIAIGEIAFLLGFSEVSAFNRAFRRWTGTTPSAYRAAGERSSA